MSTSGRFFRLLIPLGALLCLPGCGVGALIAGGIAALVIAENGGSSGSASAPQAFLDSSFTRQDLVDSGSAEIIPVCYHIVGDASVEAVQVQYLQTGSSSWEPASRAAGAPSIRCGEHTFWWDADRDLGLTSPSPHSRVVRVRVFVGQDRSRAHVSGPFAVGNTPHELNLVDLSPVVRDEVPISFVARDVDGPAGDQLLEVRVQYRLPVDPDTHSCVGVDPDDPPTDCGGEAAVVSGDGWIDARRFDKLAAPPLSEKYDFLWNTRCAAGIGDRDVAGIELRVVARDGFGVEREFASRPFRVDNNREPRITFLGTNPDEQTGFEVPLVFQALDGDGDALDVVLQFAREGQTFEPLDAAFDECPTRRERLSDPDLVGLRRQLGIITLSKRGPGFSMQGLASSESGVKHVLVWDSEKDLGPFSRERVRIRGTVFDSFHRTETTAVGIAVDNTVLTHETTFAEGATVAGLAAGDIDGDGRTDLAVSHTRASDEGGMPRVAIHVQRSDGSFSAVEDFALLPPPDKPLWTPIGLVLCHLDGDSTLDLLVLNNNCEAGNTCTAIGEVSVHFGRPGQQQAFSDSPDLLLTAGRDVRDLVVGEFDGLAGLDIAVSNHDDQDIGVFFHTGSRSFAVPMECIPVGDETGSLAAGNFDGDAGGVFEIVVRKRDRGEVDLYRWSPAMARFEPWETIRIPSPVSLVARDLDGDGDPDLVVGSRGARSVSVYENNSSPDRPHFENTAEFCLADSPETFLLADLLGDGRRSIVALERASQQVEILLEGEARLCCEDDVSCRSSGIPLSIPDGDSGLSATALAADLDGDGRDDLVFGSQMGGAPLFRARSAGSLVPELRQSLVLGADDQPARFVTGDTDGDSLVDLGVAFPPARGARAYGVHLFRQGDAGAFSRIPTQTLRSLAENPQSELDALGDDADGDGVIDYIVMSQEGGTVVFARDGDLFATDPTVSVNGAPPCAAGPGAPPEIFPAGPLLVGDFDAAHDRELVHFDRGRRKLSLLGVDRATDADGIAVVVEASLCLEGFPESIAASDMDGDGPDDLVLLDRSGEVTVRLRDAARPWPGSFEAVHASLDLAIEVGLASTFGDILAGDVDLDGRVDLIAVDSGPGVAKKIWGFRQLPPENGERLGAFELAFELDPLESGERPDFRVVLGDTELIDLTGDDLPDFAAVVESPPSARLAIFHQARSGGFAPRPSRTLGITENFGGRIDIAGVDLTGDLRPELLMAIPGGRDSSNELRILRTR